ncbi:MAG: response regulator [Patescibacteria group bacterium]
MKSILLVEDDPFLSDIYITKLKEAGFEVDAAGNGEEAVKKITEKMPDLILLDIVLPKFDGWEVLKKIKSEDNLKAIPVVILSNLGQENEVQKGINLGAVKYLIKAHFTPSEVAEEIGKILENKY